MSVELIVYLDRLQTSAINGQQRTHKCDDVSGGFIIKIDSANSQMLHVTEIVNMMPKFFQNFGIPFSVGTMFQVEKINLTESKFKCKIGILDRVGENVASAIFLEK
jgi:hypothetical protein